MNMKLPNDYEEKVTQRLGRLYVNNKFWRMKYYNDALISEFISMFLPRLSSIKIPCRRGCERRGLDYSMLTANHQSSYQQILIPDVSTTTILLMEQMISKGVTENTI